MTKNNPLVSIIIPVYNGANYLKYSIDSALNQTYPNIEVIVVNDGSNDNGATRQIAESYGNKIKYYEKENDGVASALNLGIEKMTGDYFSWLSHDDEYLPEKVEKQIEKLKTLDNDETIIACNVTVISYAGKVIKHNYIPDKARRSMQLYLAYDQTTGLNGCSLLIKKELFKKYGYFNVNLKVTQDYDMWFRLAKNVPFDFVDDHLVLSRQHPEQASKTMINEVSYEVDKLHSRFIREADYSEFKKFASHISEYFDYYYQYLNMGCYESAVEASLKYVQLLCEEKEEEKAINFINYNVFNNSELYDVNKNILKYKNKKVKKRLLFYNNVWIKGGIERVISKVLEKLVDDYDIFFVTFNFIQNEGYDLPKKIKKIQISNDLKAFLPYVILFLAKYYEIDVFFGNQNLNIDFLPTYKVLNENNIKSVAVNHYNYFLPFNVIWLNDVAIKRNEYYKYADVVTWPTKFSARIYGAVNNNSYYLPNPNSFEISTNNMKKPFTIISVARFDDTFKRIDLLLKVFKKALKDLPKLKLIVVGKYDLNMVIPDNQKQTLKDLLNELNIPNENLEFVGEQSDVTKYYKQAELLVHTSETEGFGMVLNEAATHGVPTIAFNICGLEDIIINGENGYLVKKYDLDEMKEKIVQYFSDENLKNDMQNKALELSKRFDFNEVIKNWYEILETLFSDEKYILEESDFNFKKAVNEYEFSLINCINVLGSPMNNMNEKASLAEKIKYYYKTYGLTATIKKIIKKAWSVIK